MALKNTQKILVGTACMTVWGILVWQGKTEVAGYVDMIKQILMAVGVYHLAITPPKG